MDEEKRLTYWYQNGIAYKLEWYCFNKFLTIPKPDGGGWRGCYAFNLDVYPDNKSTENHIFCISDTAERMLIKYGIHSVTNQILVRLYMTLWTEKELLERCQLKENYYMIRSVRSS